MHDADAPRHTDGQIEMLRVSRTHQSQVYREITGLWGYDQEALFRKHGLMDMNPQRARALTILRASEGCARRAWLTHHLSLDALKEATETRRPIASWSQERLRLDLGNVLEDQLIDAAIAKHGWSAAWHQQLLVSYYDDAAHALLIGHIDGVVSDDAGDHLLEVKTTSEERFNEVRAAMLDPGAESVMLEKYRQQMRRYLGMIRMDADSQLSLNPTHGKLLIFNRNSCEMAVFDVPLFAAGELNWEWMHREIGKLIVVPTDREPPVPLGYFRSHPICQTCIFWKKCYTGEREAVAVSRELEQLGEDYIAADSMHKAGDAKKKRVRAQVLDAMREMEEAKLQLGDDVVASKSSRRGSNRIDRDRMREDGVLDRYLVEGKPYEVVSLKIRR